MRQAEKKSAEGDLEKENEAMVRRLGVFSTEILKAGRGMPFSVNKIVSAYDDATRDEFPERAVGVISIRPVVEKANAKRDNLVSAITSLEGGLKAEEDKLSLAETELARLKAQKESTPRIECFDDADAAVEESMLDAYPLYRRLEPMPGLKEREIAILEQVIGDDVLGTWIVSEKDADALRKLLFGDFPAQSIAVATEDEPEFPCSWLKKYFDFDKSAPDALVALANQLASKSGPHIEKFLDDTIMHFRRRERPSRYSRPRLIGTEARVAELRRKTREQEEACASLKKAIREIGSKIDDAKADKAAVCHLESLLQQAQDELAGLARRVSTARSTCAQAERFWEEARDAMAACEEDRTRAADRHGDILLQMNGRGIGADLQERIAKAEREKRRLESDWEDCTKECGQLEARIQDLTSCVPCRRACCASAIWNGR